MKADTRAANTYALLGEYQEAFQQIKKLRDADRRLADATNAKQGNELKVRFDVQLKEAENALLRSQKKEADSRRLALVVGFGSSLLLLGGFAFYLRRRAVAAKREAAYLQSLASADAI